MQLCVCAYSILVWGKLHQDKQGLKGHIVKLVQHHPSNETDTFPLCNELVLRLHCLVCIIIYTYKKRVPNQQRRYLLDQKFPRQLCKIKADLIMP